MLIMSGTKGWQRCRQYEVRTEAETVTTGFLLIVLDLHRKKVIAEKEEDEQRMTREMEYAKCIAVLRKIVRMGMITENEYVSVRSKLMDKFLFVHSLTI